MYSQRPTQISVLRRGKNFNDEVADYAHLGLKASHGLKLVAQKSILEYIPMLHGQFAIKSPSTDPGCVHYKNKEGDSHSFSISLFTIFSTLFSRR
jgi:hypothetical protein